ncbi:hypothetical protein K469DRAFT_702623 [Zopfia rhizophila CBS 207.26]|uniref:Uncharacterized protein n=1 Tax=Zopfia rhizophila CBS 207.26 TaxID=1314779 RepID=A0A6A6ED08_9PEZI|nr:hypothetical protein K469DRAFT_702623 [Zopfia rhizophila CBS 207.26]
MTNGNGGRKTRASSKEPESLKRMREEYSYVICKQCGEEFDRPRMGNRAVDGKMVCALPFLCLHQSLQIITGKMEIDYDREMWSDWEGDIYGPCDTDQNREKYSEGFVWNCCDERGDSENE